MSDTIEDFDHAKNIAAILKDLDKERQQKVLRWVAENLDIPLGMAGPTTAAGAISTQTVPSAAQVTQASTGTGQRPVDIRSFIAEKNPKTDVQFAAVVAYYHRFVAESRQETISSSILQDAARLANRRRLHKAHITLNNAKKAGYLDAAGRGAFRINSVGENLVAMTLPGTGDDVPKAPVKRRKAPRKPAAKRRAK